MRRWIPLALVLTLIGLCVGCTKYSFMPMHKKIVGVWGYEKVVHRPGLLKNKINITREFEHWELHFRENGSVEAYNLKDSSDKIGRWYVDEYRSTYVDEDGSTNMESEYILSFNLRDTRGKEEHYVWKLGTVTAKRLRAYEDFGNESRHYVLYRK